MELSIYSQLLAMRCMHAPVPPILHPQQGPPIPSSSPPATPPCPPPPGFASAAPPSAPSCLPRRRRRRRPCRPPSRPWRPLHRRHSRRRVRQPAGQQRFLPAQQHPARPASHPPARPPIPTASPAGAAGLAPARPCAQDGPTFAAALCVCCRRLHGAGAERLQHRSSVRVGVPAALQGHGALQPARQQQAQQPAHILWADWHAVAQHCTWEGRGLRSQAGTAALPGVPAHRMADSRGAC